MYEDTVATCTYILRQVNETFKSTSTYCTCTHHKRSFEFLQRAGIPLVGISLLFPGLRSALSLPRNTFLVRLILIGRPESDQLEVMMIEYAVI